MGTKIHKLKSKITLYLENQYSLTKFFLIILAVLSEIVLICLFINVPVQKMDLKGLMLTIFTLKPLYFDININLELLKQTNFNKFLTVVISALSTLLAIVFALSQFIISNIMDKYSVQIIEKYEKNSKTRLFIRYICIISFSFFLMLITNLKTTVPVFYLFSIILISYLFIISFAFLIDYINYMFTLINPLKFVDMQKEDIMMAILNQNENDVRLGIIAMGDTTIKLMRKGEEKICLKYIHYFKDIFLDFMTIRDKSPNLYVIKIFRSYEKGETKNNILNYILNEYFRIYKESTSLKQDVLSKEIVDGLFKILESVIYAK